MQYFLQGFVIVVCAYGFQQLVLANVAKLSASRRVALGVMFTAVAFFAALFIQRISTPPSGTASQIAPVGPPSTQAQPSKPPEQIGSGPQSSQNSGDQARGGAPQVSAGAKMHSAVPQEETTTSEPANFNGIEVLYDGPTAAGGVVNPRDIMAKELSEAGFEVLLNVGRVSEEAPHAVASRTPNPAVEIPSLPASRGPVPSNPVVSRSPSGLSVKEIFDFVRKAQQGRLIDEPVPHHEFQFPDAPVLFAIETNFSGHVVIAMRASMRHLREFQGIFSTEVQMEIVAVATRGRTVQTVIAMAGPENARGFGLDWEQAEQKALSEISSQMCPPFAKRLREKLGGEK